jgi:hypothetical protein
MKWTSEKPKQPGWYWWRSRSTSNSPTICELIVEHKALIPAEERYRWGYLDRGDWAGPLEPPT